MASAPAMQLRTTRTARSPWSCPMPPAAASTCSRASLRSACRTGSASRSWSRTAPAPAPSSARLTSPRAAPDGYTLMLGTSTPFAINVTLHKNLPYDPGKDFAPIVLTSNAPFMLLVNDSAADQVGDRLDQVGEVAAGQALLRLGRRRLAAAPEHGAAQDHDRHQHRARALSRRCAGAQRSGRRRISRRSSPSRRRRCRWSAPARSARSACHRRRGSGRCPISRRWRRPAFPASTSCRGR